MAKSKIFSAALFTILSLSAGAQNSTDNEDTGTATQNIKKGFTFGGVPAISYDRDVGFRYGALVNLYFFGDGSRYPRYDHSIYMQYSRTTKGSSLSQFTYDSDRLLKGIRSVIDICYETDQALDFYGFNGYRSKYNSAFEDDTNPTAYLSRMFYRHERKLLKIRTEFTGDIVKNRVKWFGGIEFFDNRIDSVNLDKLNKGKDAADILPAVGGGIFQKYLDWNIIPADEAGGGIHTLFKGGLVFDTRDNEPNPMKGIWTDAILILSPGFSGSRNVSYGKFALTHRQYFTLLRNDLNFAYRISYQGKLFGDIPFYMLPFVYNSPPNYTNDGLGGSKTLRGVLRNRVAGDDYLYGNVELRWKFIHTKLLKQNFHIALSAFLDAGTVTRQHKADLSSVPATFAINGKTVSKDDLFAGGSDGLHLGAGGGIHFVLNDNFIVAVDYGVPLRISDDGTPGLYIGLNWLY
jgi:hypothetical protein